MENQVRQGDVLLEIISEIPQSASLIDDRVLAHGEFSGHGHVITGDAAVLKDKDGSLFVDAGEGVSLQHLLVQSGVWTGEHLPIALAAGKYRVVQQREFDPYESAIRNVID